jgi:trehalose 6-phosphate synthase
VISPSSAAVLVASNRGPLSFDLDDARNLTARRGGGGLVSGLSSVGGAEKVWVCAALSEADRTAARRSPGGRLDHGDVLSPEVASDVGAVKMLDIPRETFTAAYNTVANSTLWFVHHMLYNTPLEPAFDGAFATAWRAYRAYNEAFAQALAVEAGQHARVLIQDYHLALAPTILRRKRSDLRIAHFSHTPWSPPQYFGLLPDNVADEVLLGMLGADRVGFLTRRWADAFLDCVEDRFNAEVDRESSSVRLGGRVIRVGVHSLGVDGAFLRERAFRADVEERLSALRDSIGDRKVIVRVDRTELSKNIVRGLLAYADLLRRYPEWRGKVTHVAFAYPSRDDLASYRAYTEEVRQVAKGIEEEFGTDDWQPLILHVEDDFARSLAAYRLADVALVNPIRDGMNLVAKEIPVIAAADSARDGCALVLSREAGAFTELGHDVLAVNPYDITATADALRDALAMAPAERRSRSRRLAAAATAMPPSRWFTEQLSAL